MDNPIIEKLYSRRNLLTTGLKVGAVGSLGLLAACSPSPASASSAASNAANDIPILNGAIGLENQAIWAYGAAIQNLQANTDATSKAVVAIAQAHTADHKAHLQALSQAVTSLGGTPTPAQSTYDLSAYTGAGLGAVDGNPVHVAKLALALEVDAALAYAAAFASLKTVSLLQAAATIAPDESAHAMAIRAALGLTSPSATAGTPPVPPASLLSASTRASWVATD